MQRADASSSSTPAYRTTDALGRQTWSKEFFAAKALARQYEGADPGLNFLQGEFGDAKNRKAVPPPVDRRALQHRKEAVVLDAEVGKARVVTPFTPRPEQGGFWCEICECLMKDSAAYLDHINGKRHNRQLGMTMRVEKVDSSRIREKLRGARLERAKKQEHEALDGLGGIELRLHDAAEREKQKKLERKQKKKKKKRQRESDEDEEARAINPFEAFANGLIPPVDALGDPAPDTMHHDHSANCDTNHPPTDETASSLERVPRPNAAETPEQVPCPNAAESLEEAVCSSDAAGPERDGAPSPKRVRPNDDGA